VYRVYQQVRFCKNVTRLKKGLNINYLDNEFNEQGYMANRNKSRNFITNGNPLKINQEGAK